MGQQWGDGNKGGGCPIELYAAALATVLAVLALLLGA